MYLAAVEGDVLLRVVGGGRPCGEALSDGLLLVRRVVFRQRAALFPEVCGRGVGTHTQINRLRSQNRNEMDQFYRNREHLPLKRGREFWRCFRFRFECWKLILNWNVGMNKSWCWWTLNRSMLWWKWHLKSGNDNVFVIFCSSPVCLIIWIETKDWCFWISRSKSDFFFWIKLKVTFRFIPLRNLMLCLWEHNEEIDLSLIIVSIGSSLCHWFLKPSFTFNTFMQHPWKSYKFTMSRLRFQ